MNAKPFVPITTWTLAAAGMVLAVTLTASAQVKTEKSVVSEGAKTENVTVERGEVVWVSGNNLMVKGESGEMRYFPNIPDTARVTVAGKELGVQDLQPGMKLERTTITTTTPKTIRTTRSVTGTVWQVGAPTWVILTLPDKTNQKFTIPRDQKFLIDGKQVDAFGLRQGMRVSATAVSDSLENVSTQQVTRTGAAPPPPPTPPAPPARDVAVLIVEAPPTPVATAGVQELPRTASPLPLIGLLGLAACGAGIVLRAVRRSSARRHHV
jgi:hypothetical protein